MKLAWLRTKVYRYSSCLLLLILVLTIGNGCNVYKRKESLNNQNSLRDYFGRNIVFPDSVRRVLPLYYVPAEIVYALGAKNTMVGIGRIKVTNSYLLDTYFHEVHMLPKTGTSTQDMNYELILSLKPDLVFVGTDIRVNNKLNELNLVTYSNYPKTARDILTQVDEYGYILDRESEAMRITAFLENILYLVTSKSSIIDDHKRPKVYYARTDPLTTVGGTQNDIIYISGGISVSQHLNDKFDSSISVSLEDIYSWNPDIIIVRDRASFKPEDLYNDPLWKDVKAVKENNVFQERQGWTEFRLETFFGIMEKAIWFQPELFSDLKPEKEYMKFIDIIVSNQDKP